MTNDCTGILKNISVAPMGLIRYFPIVILLYLFSAELIQTLNSQNSSLRFESKKTGIIFFHNFQIWLAIFETLSVEKIETSELKQLKYLKTFSLEVDRKKNSIRVILYSKSAKELEKRIKVSKPILEAVLPDISIISKDDATELYGETELLKIGNMSILRGKSEWSYPEFGNYPRKDSPSISRIVLACNISDEVEKNKFLNCVQLYFLHCFDQTSFFKYINKRFFKSLNETAAHFQDDQELQRIRLSYQTKKTPLFSFQEGLNQFTRALSTTSLVTSFNKTEERNITYPLIKSQYNLPIAAEKTTTSVMNQICYELCQFPNQDLSVEEKAKRCKKRADFCLNLLKNENFRLILENFIKQGNETDQIHLISELRQHLTYQQLICCFSHLSQQEDPEISYQTLLSLIHGLFRSVEKIKEGSKINKKHITSIFTNNGNPNQKTLSLTQN
ncbi:MAG: hypothetical protein ACFFFH_19365 [Candidatus Thorarchaeota archaeon]